MKVTDDDIMKINFDRQGQKWMMAKNMGMAKATRQYPELTVEKGHEGIFTFVIQSPSTVNFAVTRSVRKSNGKKIPDFWNQLEVDPGSTDKNDLCEKQKLLQ